MVKKDTEDKAMGISLTHKYQVHGACVESDVPFPDFIPLLQGRAEITLRRSSPAEGGMGELSEEAIQRRSYYHLARGGTEAFTYYGFPTCVVARWHRLCDFQVSRNGAHIACHPWPNVPWADIRPFLLGRVVPLACNLRGVVTLHSAGVSLPGGAIALIARSGTGKSTLSASLASQGCAVVADDVLAIREEQSRFLAQRGYLHVRLTEESLDFLKPRLNLAGEPEPDYDKARICLQEDSNARDSMPLRAVYLLNRTPSHDPKDIQVTTLPPRDALPALMRNISNHLLLDLPHIRQQFGVLSRLVSQIPVKTFEYPSGFEMINDVTGRLFDDYEALEQQSPRISNEDKG